MFIEQSFEFELKGPGPPSRGPTCTLTTGYFYDKTNASEENLREDDYLLLKFCTRQSTLLPLPGQKHLQALTPKCKISSVFCTYILRKRRIQ